MGPLSHIKGNLHSQHAAIYNDETSLASLYAECHIMRSAEVCVRSSGCVVSLVWQSKCQHHLANVSSCPYVSVPHVQVEYPNYAASTLT